LLERYQMLDEEKRLLLDSISSFRTTVLDDAARELDETPHSGRVEEVWRKTSSLGLPSALLSEQAGGQGMDYYSFCLVLSEVARASAGFGALLMSHNLALWALERTGEWQPPEHLLDGRARAALAWPLYIADGAWEAPFVLGGSNAWGFVLASQDGGDTCLVAPGDPGVSVVSVEEPLGLRAAVPSGLEVKPAAPVEVLGSIGDGGIEELEKRLLLGVAALAHGITRNAHDQSYTYAKERYQGGGSIIGHQAIRIMLSGMVVGVVSGEALIREACSGDGALRIVECRTVKVLVCERAMVAASDAVQVHGGYGYMRDYEVERLMRDAKYLQSYPRSAQEEMLATLVD